jgi:PTS system nitrogen regulatory IIA component
MSHAFFSIDELAERLGRDRREVEKLADRGRIPGRKVGGVWQFHPTEIRHWVEQEMREYSEPELAALEEAQRPEGEAEEGLIVTRISPETVQVPLPGRTKRSVLESLVEVAGRTWQVWEPSTVLNAVLERDRPDALGNSVRSAAAPAQRFVFLGGLSRLANAFERAGETGPDDPSTGLSRRAAERRNERGCLSRD